MNNKQITETAIFTALYYVLGVIFAPFGFMAIQVRVACALIPLIALRGLPSVIGITIGHFMVNLGSPLGTYDLLSPIIFLGPRLLIMKYGIKAMPIHTIIVGIWVGIALNATFGLMLTPSMLTVGIGEMIAEWYLGYILLYPRIEKTFEVLRGS